MVDHSRRQNKILYVATTPLGMDGLSAVLLYCAAVAAETMEVCFALGEDGDEHVLERLKHIGKVFYMPSRRAHTCRYIARLGRLIKKEKIRMVYIHGNSATMALDLFAAKIGGAEVRIAHTHNSAFQPLLKRQTLGRVMNCLVTHPVACSRAAGERCYTKAFRVITNGIDCNRFSFSCDAREKMRHKLGLEDSFVIGHLGRFSEQKNHARLLDIFSALHKKNPSARLLLCGEGELMDLCREKAAKLKLQDKIIFCGNVAEPEQYLCAMDVFVLPSLFEGLPLVGVEAQASGLPCVFSSSITKETKILPSCWFVSLDETDEAWADTLALAGQTAVERKSAAKLVEAAGFTKQTVQEQIAELYCEIQE